MFFMARPLRIEYPGAYYHVMNRGLSRRDIFLDDKGREWFLDLLSDISRLWKIEIYAYCLMDNHYHLLFKTPQGGLSRAMRHLDGIYTQRFNRAHHRDGPLLRGRYKAILIDAEEHFLSIVRYIDQKLIVGDKGFIEWVRERLGDRARVEEEKPESRRVFGLGIEEIARATARVYGKRLEELRRKRRGEENEARSMAMYMCRMLGGHKHGEIGKVLGLEKTSSVSSVCLRMKARVEAERKIGRRAR